MTIIADALQREHDGLADRMVVWDNHKVDLQPLVDKLAPLSIVVGFPDSLDFQAVGDRNVFLTFLRELRKLGYKPDSNAPETKQPIWSSFFNSPRYPIRIWLHFTSTVCRRVKVGQKTELVDVFEVVCDDSVTMAEFETHEDAAPSAEPTPAGEDALNEVDDIEGRYNHLQVIGHSHYFGADEALIRANWHDDETGDDVMATTEVTHSLFEGGFASIA